MVHLTSLKLPDGFWDRPDVIRAADIRDIPALIQLILDAAHVTQRELAVVCGFHTTQVSHYKHRIREPHLESIAKLADGTQMSCSISYQQVVITKDRAWVRLWLSRDCFDSVRAVLYAFLGQLDEAREVAEHVATRIPQPEGKTDAIVLTNVALAQTQTGLFKRAADTGTSALGAMRRAETSTCIGRLGCAAVTLRNHASGVPQVEAFLRDFEATAREMTPARTTAS